LIFLCIGSTYLALKCTVPLPKNCNSTQLQAPVSSIIQNIPTPVTVHSNAMEIIKLLEIF
jgi:hypothetical protein